MLRRSNIRRVLTGDDWLHKSQINERIVGVQYAVRGKIPERAQELKKDPIPDKKIIECNIGNPQAIGNPYLSFPREVLSVFTAPHILKNREKALQLYSSDVIERAEEYLNHLGHSGGYTNSNGMMLVQKNIAKYIQTRDHMKTQVKPESVFCTDGASRGVQLSLSFIHNSSTDGVLVPVPQYPLYSATLHLLGMRMCPYFLDESNNWDLNIKTLENAYNLATFSGTNVKAIVVINPGNPTGQVLSKDTVGDVVDFARRRGLAVLADEVYQDNVYDEKKAFYSMHRGFTENPLPAGVADVPCFSYHSTSKGIIGECGRRGGYTHLANIERKEILPLYNKLTSVNLCSNITGQLTTDLMLRPPTPGQPSYERHRTEYDNALNSYKKRAKILVDGLNKIPGIKSNPIEGAMYAFPRIELPDAYKKKASSKLVHPDFMWCMELVENERVVVVPGSGFEQEPGTCHFRTTILPREDEMEEVVTRIRSHQERINAEYGSTEPTSTISYANYADAKKASKK